MYLPNINFTSLAPCMRVLHFYVNRNIDLSYMNMLWDKVYQLVDSYFQGFVHICHHISHLYCDNTSIMSMYADLRLSFVV